MAGDVGPVTMHIYSDPEATWQMCCSARFIANQKPESTSGMPMRTAVMIVSVMLSVHGPYRPAKPAPPAQSQLKTIHSIPRLIFATNISVRPSRL